MKTTKQGVIALLAAFAAGSAFAQTNLNFNWITATIEGAIHLSWNSTPGEIYQIQCADALVDTNTGTITWQMLYDNYPSHGTNTFWLDTGNYVKVPTILHPAKMPMRFYRIMNLRSDTTPGEPSVTIISPSNGGVATNELIINVAANTDQTGDLTTKLYVVGQEMRAPIGSTNWADGSGLTNFLIDTYTINTCEWPNGAHTLFATATATSAHEGTILGAPPVLEGHGVSPFVQTIFTNLITRISFSEPFFDPALGQTQQVRAVFAANVDWTLTIRDLYSNAVRNVTGSGASMLFNWDGKGDGGTNLNPGVYYYYVSAQTNGQAMPADSSWEEDGGGPPGFSMSVINGDSAELQAEVLFPRSARQAVGAGLDFYYAELPPMPPVYTNGEWLPWEDVYVPQEPERVEISDFQIQRLLRSLFGISTVFEATAETSGPEGSNPLQYAGAPAQAAPPAPRRPPTAPKNGTPGTFGIAWQSYLANGTNGFEPSLPRATYPPFNTYVTMEGHGTADPPKFGPLRLAGDQAIYFGAELSDGAWSPGYTKSENELTINDLRGSSTPFNQVDIGFLGLHCVYGTSQDFYAGGCQQMYFPITAGNAANYLRMSEMSFGGDGTNGLKWIALKACSSLYHNNWASMQTQHVHPYSSGLHLLLGVDTKDHTAKYLGRDWAAFMLGKPLASPPVAPMKIRDAWYAGARKAYQESRNPYEVSPMKFAVAGDTACFDDFLQRKTNTVLSGTWKIDPPTQVYPP